GDGVNVLCAANEYGKSTSFEALHALFFQPHSGKAGDVQRLRPYSGGSPLVEADIVTSEGRFRITKQYYGGGSARVTDLETGRLLAQVDEAENFISSLIGGGSAGPAGLLWVRQGITGIEKRSRAEEDSEKQVRAGLLESVQGEVEAVTGGRRMAEIMAAVEDALAELVTATGRPKSGGRYAGAIETRDQLAGEEKRLAGEVAVLREALDKRATAARRLAELDGHEDRQERRRAIEVAQSALDAARAQSATLKTAEAELALARERHAAAAQDIAVFRDALHRADGIRRRLRDAEQRRGDVVDGRRSAIETVERARADAEAAEAEERETRDLLARLDTAARARAALEHRAALMERLGKAEAARQALEECEARLALLHVPPKALDALQALEIEIARIRAVEDAARPSVSIAYRDDVAARVTMDGTVLPDGEERGYDGHAKLLVPGLGAITLRSNRPIIGDDSLERAEARRRALLSSMGVEDLPAARDRQLRAQEMEADRHELRGRLSQLAPDGLPKLREMVAEHAAIDTGLLELKDDPAQVGTALAEAEARRARAREALRAAEPLRIRADEAFVSSETELAALGIEQAQLDAILGPEGERGQREAALSHFSESMRTAFAAAETHAARLRAEAVDLEAVEAALKRARSVNDAVESEIQALRETVAGLNSDIRARSDEAVEEKWRETGEALSAATARAAAFGKEVAVLRKLSSALEAARSEARELYLKPVMTELRPLLGMLFDDASITFDDRTLLPQTLLRSGQEEDVDRLSGGMREQLSILTRLAFARLLARDGRPAPVILDDALVYSDDDRIEKMFDALHRQSKDQQIIVFSCRQRAFQRLGGNVLRMTDWQP
ncbi:MAG: DNA-binding protein, partial [Rhizobiaceae bacterium]|nr:DNA-binding protein [Rhizobiaceae bacterium]